MDATSRKCREASFDGADGVVAHSSMNRITVSQTTPSARAKVASQLFLDRAATPPPTRRGVPSPLPTLTPPRLPDQQFAEHSGGWFLFRYGISVNDLSMRFGARILFRGCHHHFLSGRRYAITGPNGAGKSTFMKILTGEIEPAKGSVTRPKKVGILRQDQFAFDAYRVIDTVIMGNAPLWDALQEREMLYAKDADQLTDEDGMRLGELEGIVGDEGGYTAETDAASLLDGLDIAESLHERKMSELQGGQKVRVLLAQALFGNASVLLLDEPTNNLDLDSVHWLQDYLLAYNGCLIVISHDRHFLNDVCTHIADIDYQSIITYTGGYDDMVLAKTQIRSRIEAGNAQREKKIAQLNEFIARFSAGTRSSQVTSRKKEVERLQTSDLAKSNIQRPFIRFQMNALPAGIRSKSKDSRSPTKGPEGDSELHRVDRPRRKDRAARPQRLRQDDHAEIADPQCDRLRRCRRSGNFRSMAAW